eukprot:8340121-Pyramimonas_sp.AAC.1
MHTPASVTSGNLTFPHPPPSPPHPPSSCRLPLARCSARWVQDGLDVAVKADQHGTLHIVTDEGTVGTMEACQTKHVI